MERESLQEALYDFPYHHIPIVRSKTNVWSVSRYLYWGYEYLAILNTIIDLVLCHKPKRLIDFGCGDGRLIKELLIRNENLEVIGVDISECAISFARAFLQAYPKVHFFQKVQDIPYSLLPVDSIIAMEVLEHIPPYRVRQVVTDFYRVLHPGGIVVISVPTMNVPVRPKHYQHFSLDTVLAYTDGLFSLKSHLYIHKIGLLQNLIRRSVVNRLFIANSELWLKMTTWLYIRWVMKATPKNGAHLICVLQPVSA
jgi:2-polyprenyl-3-methyl-5-hydroxy-6-metoxy-1,4-benzoquinol methylase